MNVRSSERKVEQIVGRLAQRTELGFKMFSYLVDKDFLKDIIIDDSTWVSKSNTSTGIINLGTGPVSQLSAERMMFEGGASDQEALTLHRFNHEMTHLFVGNTIETTDATQNLAQLANAVRKENDYDLGLSAVGSMPFYDKAIRYNEDLAELGALRLHSRDKLSRFALYASNSSNKSTLADVGVASFEQSGVTTLINMVDSAIAPVYAY